MDPYSYTINDDGNYTIVFDHNELLPDELFHVASQRLILFPEGSRTLVFPESTISPKKAVRAVASLSSILRTYLKIKDLHKQSASTYPLRNPLPHHYIHLLRLCDPQTMMHTLQLCDYWQLNVDALKINVAFVCSLLTEENRSDDCFFQWWTSLMDIRSHPNFMNHETFCVRLFAPNVLKCADAPPSRERTFQRIGKFLTILPTSPYITSVWFEHCLGRKMDNISNVEAAVHMIKRALMEFEDPAESIRDFIISLSLGEAIDAQSAMIITCILLKSVSHPLIDSSTKIPSLSEYSRKSLAFLCWNIGKVGNSWFLPILHCNSLVLRESLFTIHHHCLVNVFSEEAICPASLSMWEDLPMVISIIQVHHPKCSDELRAYVSDNLYVPYFNYLMRHLDWEKKHNSGKSSNVDMFLYQLIVHSGAQRILEAYFEFEKPSSDTEKSMLHTNIAIQAQCHKAYVEVAESYNIQMPQSCKVLKHLPLANDVENEIFDQEARHSYSICLKKLCPRLCASYLKHVARSIDLHLMFVVLFEMFSGRDFFTGQAICERKAHKENDKADSRFIVSINKDDLNTPSVFFFAGDEADLIVYLFNETFCNRSWVTFVETMKIRQHIPKSFYQKRKACSKAHEGQVNVPTQGTQSNEDIARDEQLPEITFDKSMMDGFVDALFYESSDMTHLPEVTKSFITSVANLLLRDVFLTSEFESCICTTLEICSPMEGNWVKTSTQVSFPKAVKSIRRLHDPLAVLRYIHEKLNLPFVTGDLNNALKGLWDWVDPTKAKVDRPKPDDVMKFKNAILSQSGDVDELMSLWCPERWIFVKYLSLSRLLPNGIRLSSQDVDDLKTHCITSRVYDDTFLDFIFPDHEDA